MSLDIVTPCCHVNLQFCDVRKLPGRPFRVLCLGAVSTTDFYFLTEVLIYISFGMFMYCITYPLILITSTFAIFNSPICPQVTALILTSDDFHSIFPPSPPFLPPSCLASTLVAISQNRHMVPSLQCVHIHLLSSVQERHL